MSNQLKLWILGPIVVALVLLVSLQRGANRGAPGAAAPATESHTAVAGADPQVAPDVEPIRPEAEPRHPGIGFRTRERLVEHFRKHGREFQARSAEEYLRLAQSLRDRSRGPEVLEFVRNDAVTCKFDRVSGAFVAYNSDGTLRTFFRPNDGEAYFERQKSHPREAP